MQMPHLTDPLPARRSLWVATLFSVSALLAACGGSDNNATSAENGSNPGADTPSAGQTTLNSGSVRGVGSFMVNGVHYNEENISITIDNGDAAEADLALGMVADVEGSIDETGITGTAVVVDVNSALAGQVSDVSVADNRFTVLGTTVLINYATIFEAAQGLSDLPFNDRVVVYGSPDN